MTLLKCFTQYASKYGKLSSGHRTGKGSFLFQSWGTAVPKNVQVIIQLHSFHMLARLWAGVQLQQPGIQPEGVCGIGEKEAASHFSWTACLFQAYDSLLYFYKSIRSEVWYFQFPLTQMCCLHKSLLLFRVPASLILSESALSSIIYLL